MKRPPHNKAKQPPHNKVLYKTAAWRQIRERQLRIEPFCVMCAAEGRTVRATVCDHVTPHRGDPVAFHRGPFQSLCKACHDGKKQRQERRGYSDAIGIDGLPTDPHHPFNR